MLTGKWSNRNYHSLMMGMQNGTATLENSLVFLARVKHHITTWSTIAFLVFTQMSWKLLCQNLHMDVYSSLIYSSISWKQSRSPSVGEWVNKLWYLHMVRYYSVLKRIWQAMKGHRGNSSAYYYVKEVNLKRLHTVIPTMWHLEKQNYGDSKKD
jgi:hypothetical protein